LHTVLERLHGKIKHRDRVMRGLDEESTAQTVMDGMRIYYNFIRPHIALNEKNTSRKS